MLAQVELLCSMTFCNDSTNLLDIHSAFDFLFLYKTWPNSDRSINHWLNATTNLNIVADYVHPFEEFRLF